MTRDQVDNWALLLLLLQQPSASKTRSTSEIQPQGDKRGFDRGISTYVRVTERDIWGQPHSTKQSKYNTRYRDRWHPDMVSRKFLFFLTWMSCRTGKSEVKIFLPTTNNETKEFNNCTSFSEEEKEQISLTNMHQKKKKKSREKEEKYSSL